MTKIERMFWNFEDKLELVNMLQTKAEKAKHDMLVFENRKRGRDYIVAETEYRIYFNLARIVENSNLATIEEE